MGNCLIIPSAEGKTVVASVNVEEIKPHKIRPMVKKGRNSCIGDLNKLPKMMPMHAIVTPIEIVIQNGPRDERLYLCRISEKAR